MKCNKNFQKKEIKIKQKWKLDFVRKLSKKPWINKKYLSKIFNVARSSLYYKKIQIISDTIFSTKIKLENIFNPYYWQRRMAYYFWVSIDKTSRIMQKYNIYARVRKRKFVKPWDRNFANMWVKNIKKEINLNKSNQVWSSDFTHLYYKNIEFYLATVIDDYSKEIVWYKIWLHHEKELIFLKHALLSLK